VPPPPAQEEAVFQVFEEPLVGEESVPVAEQPKSKTNIWSLILGGLIGWLIDMAKN
jgi:hypothetical protein